MTPTFVFTYIKNRKAIHKSFYYGKKRTEKEAKQLAEEYRKEIYPNYIN